MRETTTAAAESVASMELQNAEATARTEAQNAVRQSIRDVVNQGRAGIQQGGLAIAGMPASSETIAALQAQIAAERLGIEKLTSQLTGGATDAAASSITDQIESGQERLSSLQAQLNRALGVSPAAPEIAFQGFPPGDMIPPQAVEIATSLFVTIAVIAIGVPLARAFARRLDRRGAAAAAPAASSLDPRLDRIEQAIEAIAIEVERVSEGQRFTNKLMSESRALPAPNPMEQWPQPAVKEAVPVERRGER